MGGWSAERPVSLQSGTAALRALQRKGVDAFGVDLTRDNVTVLMQGGFQRVFNALHGRGGEDGVVQGALDLLGIPYTGSGVVGCALAMDKLRSKQCWLGAGLPTPDFMMLTPETEPEQVVARLRLPIMVKPVCEGSSLGMTKVVAARDLRDAYERAAALDSAVLAESWVAGAEYTAGILGEEVLPLIKLETPRAFYDYAAKYSDETTRYVCPCGLDEDRESALQRLAWDAFRCLGATGWGRVDMMVDRSGQPSLLEVNTIPGLTDHSLVPMAARQHGIDFDALVMRILETSLGGKAV